MGSGMTNFLFFVRDERDIGFETTWQLRQNSGASVIRYLKMIKDDRQVQPWREKTERTVHPVE
jgi:hypothetical protein